MIEEKADIWQYMEFAHDAVCITTNGAVRKDGACVMGAGVAKQAAERYSHLPYQLGHSIKKSGNQPYVFTMGPYTPHIVTLPVKHHWRQQADIDLIVRSIKQLVFLTNALHWESVVLVRPGVGNGRLNWDDVKGRIEPLLDDRFTVVYQ